MYWEEVAKILIACERDEQIHGKPKWSWGEDLLMAALEVERTDAIAHHVRLVQWWREREKYGSRR